jgi:hypothetical protein
LPVEANQAVTTDDQSKAASVLGGLVTPEPDRPDSHQDQGEPPRAQEAAVGQPEISGELPEPTTASGGEDVSGTATKIGKTDEHAQSRDGYVRAYEKFQPVVDGLVQAVRAAVGTGEKYSSHEGYVGEGDSVATYGFEHDGKRYVAKVPRGESIAQTAADDRMTDLERGKGIPHLEQLVAVSPQEGVTVMECMPGTDLSQLPTEGAQHITTEQLAGAVDTMRTAQDAGILFDPGRSNIMHDTEAGFGYIDYGPQTDEGYQQSLTDKAIDMVSALGKIGMPHHGDPTTKAEYVAKAEQSRTSMGVLLKYREVCVGQLDRETFEPVVGQIDKYIESRHQFIVQVGTPGWIEDELTRKVEHDRRVSEADTSDWL